MAGTEMVRTRAPGVGEGLRRRRWQAEYGPPVLIFVVVVLLWQLVVSVFHVSPIIFPSPVDVVEAAISQWPSLITAVGATAEASVIAFLVSVVIGSAFGMLLSSSKVLERSLYPYAVALQTIPVIAIAPIILIWFGVGLQSVVAIGFIIAVFPVISNATIGLTSTDHNLLNLFEMYNASRWQTLTKLKLPFALPYLFAGMRISSGLSVIGVIVGEFVGGIAGGGGGLGYAITSAYGQLQTPFMFAAALAAALMGYIIFGLVGLLSHYFLHSWHESQVEREA